MRPSSPLCSEALPGAHADRVRGVVADERGTARPDAALPAADGSERLRLRIQGGAAGATLIYLPGLHGDWTLIRSFRVALGGDVRFIEFTYPRTVSWSLADYAEAVESALLEQSIRRGWLLGESFGSQVAWALVGRAGSAFQADGIVLAGGFVRHPMPWLAGRAAGVCDGARGGWIEAFLVLYAKYARFRHRHAPETLADIGEFVARRTDLDLRAMAQRLRLVAGSDCRGVARASRLPVYHLAGFWDPIVAWSSVRRWLRRQCPGYRGTRILLGADHNVLSTAPQVAAAQVREWIAPERAPGV